MQPLIKFNTLRLIIIRIVLLCISSLFFGCYNGVDMAECQICDQATCTNDSSEPPHCKNLLAIKKGLLTYLESTEEPYNFYNNLAWNPTYRQSESFDGNMHYEKKEFKTPFLPLDKLYLVHCLPFNYFFEQVTELNNPKTDNLYLINKGECINKGLNKFLNWKRITIHFTINHKVYAHSGFNKRNNNVAVILNMDCALDVKEGNQLYGGYLEDLFFIGPVKIPKGSTIILPYCANNMKEQEAKIKSKLAQCSIKAVFYEDSENDLDDKPMQNAMEKEFYNEYKAPLFLVPSTDEFIHSVENTDFHIESKELISEINKKYNLNIHFVSHDCSGLAQLEAAISSLILSNLLDWKGAYDLALKRIENLSQKIKLEAVQKFIEAVFKIDSKITEKSTMLDKIAFLQLCNKTNHIMELINPALIEKINS